MVTYAMMGKESRGRVELKGVKCGIFRGPDLSQHRRGFSFLTCTEQESATKGQVGQKGKDFEVKPFSMSASVVSTKHAINLSAETAGAHSTRVKGMLEWSGVPCAAKLTDCKSGNKCAKNRKKSTTN